MENENDKLVPNYEELSRWERTEFDNESEDGFDQPSYVDVVKESGRYTQSVSTESDGVGENSIKDEIEVSNESNTMSDSEVEEVIDHEMHVQLIQPWSVPIFKTQLPYSILQTMLELTDKVITDKNTESYGPTLAGQIDTELKIEHDILDRVGVMSFFLDAIRQFVITCKSQRHPDRIPQIQQEDWLPQMGPCWVVSQKPGEYNPLHWHTDCTISAIMYLKVPKMLPPIKQHRPADDGSVLFASNCSRDIEFSMPHTLFLPHVGDFFIFGANQQHSVYPFRCAEGQEDVERRSVSFNAGFQLKTNNKLDDCGLPILKHATADSTAKYMIPTDESEV